MPILEDDYSNAPVFFPDGDKKIAKYLDITRFLSMLTKSALFFCRVDKLEDKFEGTYTKATLKQRLNYLKGLTGTPYPGFNITAEKTEENIQILQKNDEQQRALFCVNCWNKEEVESAALWKIYSDFNKGIMIESSVSKIKSAFIDTPETVQISEVEYISFKDDKIPWGNTNHPFLYKDHAYHFEEEIRLLHYKIPPEGWVYDWDNEEVNEGVYLKVNLQKLITRIVLSPYSPQWFFNLIKDITEKYSLEITIAKSRLAPE